MKAKRENMYPKEDENNLGIYFFSIKKKYPGWWKKMLIGDLFLVNVKYIFTFQGKKMKTKGRKSWKIKFNVIYE
jgi:hypothetical protein